jgi:signal transduction histidine kinase
MSPPSSKEPTRVGSDVDARCEPQTPDPIDEPAPSPPKELYNPNRTFTTTQLDVLEILVHPVWIFDIDNKCMRWANAAAVEMWNASSLQELRDRDFQDMSEATVLRLQEYQCRFQRGQIVTDQWTLYPKGHPKPIHVSCSGVRLNRNEARPSMLVEGIPLVKDDVLNETLRGVEMLRHLPIPVCQFDMNGKVLFQNPEAVLIPAPIDRKNATTEISQHHTNRSKASSTPIENADGCTSETSTTKDEELTAEAETELLPDGSIDLPSGNFIERFIDQAVAKALLQDLQSTTDSVETEAEIVTRYGPRCCAVQLRRVVDPVTAEPVILYSARDMTDAIQAKKEREARERKSEFLAIMAHEIRTPLHQVMGFIELLDQTTDLSDEQQAYVNLLNSCAKGLMTVISDVLDYSKLEAGKMKLENIPFEPRSVTEGSIEAVRSSCEERGLYLILDWHKDIPFRISGDPNRLRQILLNLLSNAVKFTKEGGIHVQVLLKPQHSSSSREQGQYTSRSVHFVVKDSGMGIAEEHQRFVFSQYNQGSVSVARNFGGTGLGLSICKSLVSRMGGSIGVESEFGKGSSFWFSLPLVVPVDIEVAEPVARGTMERVGRELNILIAEDNKINQKLMNRMLDRMGHKCATAANGKEAIEAVGNGKFDLCL